MEETANQEEVQLPPIDFINFISELITTAHLYLQGFRNPETEQIIVNVGLAKRIIDTLEMIEEKTKGNLTAPEANFLANSLYELRMGYVRIINSQQDPSEPDEANGTHEQDAPNEETVTSETSEETNAEENSPSG